MSTSSTITTAYDFAFHSLNNHEPLPLSTYQGKVLLIVNTASQCGFTPQYAQLEHLYQQYKEQGLVILGVPSNDFGTQEPGSSADIAQFCQINYGVTFPLSAKEHVKGAHAHPFYLWAKTKLGFWSTPKWNFHKYLVNREGELIDYFFSTTVPSSSRLIRALNNALSDE